METPRVRPAAVAGTFYPASPSELDALIDEFIVPDVSVEAIGAIVPHAGLVYSGACAGKVFSKVAVPSSCIVLAPNHTGMGDTVIAGSWADGAFEIPTGEVDIDQVLVSRLAAATPLVGEDAAAHTHEHAVEVILPFLRRLNPDVKIVPLVLPWDDWETCAELGHVIASICAELEERPLLIASSDMNHYESADVALVKDTAALESVTRLDGRQLLETCRTHRVTMCGRAPAATVIAACHELGATSAVVADYRHSGFVTGDTDRVVSYAGVIIA
ncbi:MAG: AmmeMemoRadiSam system protein B [Gemmatimonadales bacterium]